MLRLRGFALLRPTAVVALLAGSITLAPALVAAPAASAAPLPAVGSAPAAPGPTVVESDVAARIDDEAPALTVVEGVNAPAAGGRGSNATAPTPGFDEESAIDSQQAALSALAALPGRLTTQSVGIAPFTLVGISGSVPDGQEALVRARVGGTWSSWAPLEFDSADTPDSSSPAADQGGDGVPTSEGIWFGTSDGYELSLPAGSTGITVHLAREYTPSEPTPPEPAPETLSTQAISYQPPINPRSSWGARPPKEPYSYADRVTHAVVHHSVSQNVYNPGDVPSILRSIQAYHMDSNGWNDIAYNFAVDKYGTLWEARGGGITRTVIGGHSRGANTRTTGVVALGDFSTAGAPNAMVNSIGDLLGWKLAIHGVDPNGSGPFQILAPDRYAEGAIVNFRSIIGHRDVNSTGCPGTFLYNRLDEIRQRATIKSTEMTFVAYQTNRLVGGYADYAAPYQVPGGLRIYCDWDGDGRDTLASFRHGVWYLADNPLGGYTTRVFGYGNPGDVPVCGDWDGDGRDSPGLFRRGVWALTNTTGSPFADTVFAYGNPDDGGLLIGDWDGDGRDSPGLFRSGTWALTNSLRTGIADIVIAYGNPDDRPLVGDWNDDGIDTPGVFRSGIWALTNALRTGIADVVFYYGVADDQPVVGDWNGDGIDTPAVLRFP